MSFKSRNFKKTLALMLSVASIGGGAKNAANAAQKRGENSSQSQSWIAKNPGMTALIGILGLGGLVGGGLFLKSQFTEKHEIIDTDPEIPQEMLQESKKKSISIPEKNFRKLFTEDGKFKVTLIGSEENRKSFLESIKNQCKLFDTYKFVPANAGFTKVQDKKGNVTFKKKAIESNTIKEFFDNRKYSVINRCTDIRLLLQNMNCNFDNWEITELEMQNDNLDNNLEGHLENKGTGMIIALMDNEAWKQNKNAQIANSIEKFKSDGNYKIERFISGDYKNGITTESCIIIKDNLPFDVVGVNVVNSDKENCGADTSNVLFDEPLLWIKGKGFLGGRLTNDRIKALKQKNPNIFQ